MFRNVIKVTGCYIFFGLTACTNLQSNNHTKQNVIENVSINEQLSSVTFESGVSLDFSIGLGSGAFHYANDPDDIAYFITDRGPNIKCKDDIKKIKKDLCVKGKIFPTPNYVPRIYKLQLRKNAVGKLDYKVLDMIEIKNKNNTTISGMPNDLTVTDRELGFDQFGNSIKLDNEGIDSEALVRLSDGSFWVAEEYAPSLLHIDSKGKIIERIVPNTVDIDLQTAGYPVTGKLPTILRKRMLNRGIEGLAISRDESYLYFILQSPLANPNKTAYKNSRNIRLFKVELTQGNFNKIVGEYLYHLDLPKTFGNIHTGLGDVKQNNNGSYSVLKKHQIKISEMSVLPSGALIVLERISKTTKLYQIDLQGASNLLGGKYDSEATSPALEEIQNLEKHGIQAVKKQLVFNSMIDAPNLPRKIEGIASLENGMLVLINDNDFDGSVDIRASLIKLNITQTPVKIVVSRDSARLNL